MNLYVVAVMYRLKNHPDKEYSLCQVITKNESFQKARTAIKEMWEKDGYEVRVTAMEVNFQVGRLHDFIETV